MEGQENLVDIVCGSCHAELQVLDKDYPDTVPCPHCKVPIGMLIRIARQKRAFMNTPLSVLAQAPPPPRPPLQPTEPVSPTEKTPESGYCPRHPGTMPTANCMNCGVPICQKCTAANGYYCSSECKEAVLAREPKTVRDDSQIVLDQKVDKALGVAKSVGKKVGIVGGTLLLIWIGSGVYTSFFGPKPKITASMAVMAETFHAQYWKEDQILVQQDHDLFLVQLPTQKKLWTVNLGELEEKLEIKEIARPPSRGYDAPDLDLGFSSGGPHEAPRDPLLVDSIQHDLVLIHSARQLIALNIADGSVKWKFFKPDAFLRELTPHEKGIAFLITSGREYQLTNLDWSSGEQTWSVNAVAGEISIPYGNQWAILYPETLETAKGRAAEEEATNPDNEVAGALSQPLGRKTPLRSAHYQLEFISLANGKSSGAQSLELKGFPKFQVTGSALCLMAGTDLLVFHGAAPPVWKASLGAFPTFASSSENVLAVSTHEVPEEYNPITAELAKLTGGGKKHTSTGGVATFDIKTGEPKWSKNDINPTHLAVGPDGAVYVTISVEKGEENSGGGELQHAVELTKGFKDPDAPIPVLLRIDATNGKTLWSAKYFGGEPLFFGDHVLVIQGEERINLLASEISVNDFTVSSLAAKNAKLFWSFSDKGLVKQNQMIDGKLFLVTLKDLTPSGNRYHQSYNYWLQFLERK